MTVPEAIIHVPALLQEVLENLSGPPGGRILDLTLGLGGHAEALLAKGDARTRYLGIDRDPQARSLAQSRLGQDARLSILPGRYEDAWEEAAFKAWCHRHAPEGFDIVLMDLGPSALHGMDPQRGFSFTEEGPLDMRIDPEHGRTALQWIGEQNDQSLANVLYVYGEERASRPIARAILAAFRSGRLRTTLDLAAAVHTVLSPSQQKQQIHPATRTFQAIRIAVNEELARLGEAIEQAAHHLRPGGRLGVISSNHLEDRIVKQTLRRLSGIRDGFEHAPPEARAKLLRLIPSGNFTSARGHLHHYYRFKATEAETDASHSKRLRIGERLPDDHVSMAADAGCPRSTA